MLRPSGHGQQATELLRTNANNSSRGRPSSPRSDSGYSGDSQFKQSVALTAEASVRILYSDI